MRNPGRCALWLLIGLPVSGCGAPETTIQALADLAPPLALDMLSVTVADRAPIVHWTGEDFRTGPTFAVPATPPATVGNTGEALTVTFNLVANGATISTGSVSLPARSDWAWTINILSRTSDPAFQCLGCVGSRAFTLPEAWRSPGRDSLWIVWGGNSISNPVVY